MSESITLRKVQRNGHHNWIIENNSNQELPFGLAATEDIPTSFSSLEMVASMLSEGLSNIAAKKSGTGQNFLIHGNIKKEVNEIRTAKKTAPLIIRELARRRSLDKGSHRAKRLIDDEVEHLYALSYSVDKALDKALDQTYADLAYSARSAGLDITAKACAYHELTSIEAIREHLKETP